jgi:hypothetical protein
MLHHFCNGGGPRDLRILHRFILVGASVYVYTLALNTVCSCANVETEMRRLNRGTSLAPWG